MGMGEKFEAFLRDLNTNGTRQAYRWGVGSVLGRTDPDAFLEIALKDKQGAERYLMDWIASRRGRVAGITIRNPVKALKSFMDTEEVYIAWKKILRRCPKGKKHAVDRYPDSDQCRNLLRVSDEKMKAVVLMMASSGIRVGAFDYLRMKDVKLQENGLLRIRIYRGEDEEYECFASTEAGEALSKYLDSRRAAGEEITPESPVIRDTWSYQELMRRKGAKRVGKRNPPLVTTSKAIRNQLGVLWVKAGVRAIMKTEGRTRQDFQQAHGFRKRFRTLFPASACPVHGQGDAETLMGHITSYEKPTMDHLESVYLAAMPSLLVEEKYSLKAQIKHQDQEHASKWQETRLDLLEERTKRQDLEGQVAQQAKDLQRLRELYAELERRGATWHPSSSVIS